MRSKPTIILAAAAAILPFAADAAVHGRSSRPSLRPQKTWTMPWQLSLASAASRSKGEHTYVVHRPRYGRIRGTALALRYLPAPLPRAHGRNALVKGCRAVVAKTARKLGPVRVEAASAGPQRRTRTGSLAPVGFRLVYARFDGRENYEVRQGVLTCSADRAGRIVDAYA